MLRGTLGLATRSVYSTGARTRSAKTVQIPFRLTARLLYSRNMATIQPSTSTAPSSLEADHKPSAAAKEEPVQFVAQSRSIHLYKPTQGAITANEPNALLSPLKTAGPAPAAVVIMGWMDAPLRIVSKYAAPYAKLFPEATILIKLSSGTSFVARKESREAALVKVVSILEEVNESKTSGKGILLHSFSDGGAYNLTEFLRLSAGKRVPPARAMIFDCSPGISTPYVSSTAFTIPLAKRPVIRAIVRSILYLYFSILTYLKRIAGIKTWSQIMRGHLNNHRRWSAVQDEKKAAKGNQFPPRMYLYSKADALIDWRAVESHAREAASMQGLAGPNQAASSNFREIAKDGAPVVAVRRWEKANHCDLGRADFTGYWTTVRSFLEGVL